MIRMFVRHQVADYAAWRAVYDGLDPTRREMGVTGAAVFQAVGAPTDVTVWHDFADRPAAESFAASSELRDAMEKAGVQGKPTVWFTTPA